MASGAQRPRLVIVGKKPVFRYVTASIVLFNRGSKEVELVARGKNIPLCVDTVELLRKSFHQNLRIKDISTWSEEFVVNGKTRRISYMKIVVERP
ncbi:MAG: hypothetical protein QXE96_02615 [Candidatus Caldarchaeum sp.]|jgi:DNA-binding protein Alba